MKSDNNDNQRVDILVRLRAQAMQEARPILLGTAAMLASSLSNQALPRLMGRFIDQNSNDDNYTFGIIVLGGGIASLVRTTALNRAEQSIAARLRSMAFSSLMYKDIEWFQTDKDDHKHGMSAGTIADILNQDVDKVASSLTTTVANIIRSTSAVAFSTYHMLTLDPALFGISLSIVPIVGAAAIILRKSVKKLAQQQRQVASEAAAFLEERIHHVHVVKLSNRQRDEIAHYENLQEDSLVVARRTAIQQGAFMGFLFCASSSALLLVVHRGGTSVRQGRMSSGQLTSFATYSFLLGLGTSGIVKGAGEFIQGMVSARRLYQLIDDESTNESKPQGIDVDAVKVDSISMNNVCFTYKSSGAEVLRSITLELKRGQVVALVGKNGSGKTTISSLLAGLYEPTSGSISLSDNTNYLKTSPSAKKQLVQVVPQTPAIFNMSILENVRYSNPSATIQEVRNALHLANCDSLLAAKGGIDFVVGINGSRLSGGERQRLALARSLLSDPMLLIMDEPTSSLDAEGESAVEDALKACREGNRALLLITHNAKSLEHADLVVVVKDGQIAEIGQLHDLKYNKHSELHSLMPDLTYT